MCDRMTWILQHTVSTIFVNPLVFTKCVYILLAQKIIDDVENELDKKDGVGPVHGRFYLLASNYYRQQGKHAEYYRTALRYLGCVNLDDLSFKEQMQHAFFLGLAALLGEGVYNLGELVSLKESYKHFIQTNCVKVVFPSLDLAAL